LKKFDRHPTDHHCPMATKFFNHQKTGATRAFQKHMMRPHSMAIEKFQLAQRRVTIGFGN
jgi:hypothetical protein